MPNTIKVKRGKSAALNTSTEKLQAGEVLYNLDKNYLTVGAEDNDALTKKPVAAREIVGYTGDTDSKIGASITEAYSIRYNDDSGVIVSSENNILSTPGTLKMQTPGKNISTVIISTGEIDPDGSAKPTIELSTSLGMPITLALPWKSGTLATTDDITASASTKLDNTNEDKVALKNNKSLDYTSDAAAYNIMSRDANGRARVADGVAAQDIATVGQLNTGLNEKYEKPTGGIPKSDLASAVQASLEKADSALQSHQSITTGSVNGTIAANGKDVAVKGLKALAYKDSLTKADVGLGNVDNTSDEAKPISTATQAALDEKVNTTTTVNGKALTANISLGAADVGVNETNFPGLNKTGTVTSVAVKMNGSVKGTVTSSGTIDLGTVITAHQDISGKQDNLSAAQLAAANSGITAAKVEKYDGYEGIINSKYTKPTGGIPETDLASDVQTSLGKADTALQSHQTVKLESGTNNGTLKLTVNGTATDNVAVTNLGSAAFTAASNYAAAADLENYYTKTESDGRYVAKQTGVNKLYSIDSTGQDNVLGYSQSPANSAVVQYTSSGTVRTKAPIDNLDAVNKQYANKYYETLSCYNATLIPANANLDTYVTFGNYYANSAQGVTNLPDGITSSGNTLKLSVGAASDDVAAYQILYVWASNNGEFKGKYIRSTVGEGWNAWERFTTNKDKVFSVTIYEAGE